MKKLIIGLVALCLIRVDAIAFPAYEFGNARDTRFDVARDLFVNTSMRNETWCLGTPVCTDPVEIPVKHKLVFSLWLFTNEHWQYTAAAMTPLGLAPPVRRRFVGINVEANEWPEESKVWPHLGLNYVGTVAEKENFEVKLWDELIQGPAPLENLIHEGDIVGLSLVTTGIERGVAIAERAKALGARYVVAGNDSSAFRARQLLGLPNAPIDAVFTGNSLGSIRQFFKQATAVEVSQMRIPGVAVSAAATVNPTNVSSGAKSISKLLAPADYFMIPNLGLYSPEYWDLVWTAYRSQYGHKHRSSENIRNAITLLAQGCGRAGAGEDCGYCTILEVGNIVVPPASYLERTLEHYKAFGINTFFNTTDSAFEMGELTKRLKNADSVDSLVIYGRAQAIAQRPEQLEKWLDVVKERLLINCGMDSADERILQEGIHKTATFKGSRVEENRNAVRIIKAAGEKAHLHYSLIFGSPGETHDSCKRNLEFLQWTIDTLGQQLDVVEGDTWWVNFGAPCSEIFYSYEAAERLAAIAGKSISREEWHHHFARHANELAVPFSCEESWYRFFTNITLAEAQEYNKQVRRMMTIVPGAVTGRDFAFKPPPA